MAESALDHGCKTIIFIANSEYSIDLHFPKKLTVQEVDE
jgi:hypothetical protein